MRVGSTIFLIIVIIFVWYKIDTTSVDYDKISDVSTIYYIGDTVNIGDFTVKLESFQIKKKGDSLGGYAAVDDPQWIAVFLTYTNSSGKEKSIPKNVRLINGHGEVIEEPLFYYDAWGGEHLNSAELINGGSKTGFLQFRNTQLDNVENLTLQISCNSYFDEKSTFNFKLINK